MPKKFRRTVVLVVALLALGAGVAQRPAAACPFCSAVGLTLCDSIDAASVAVVAEYRRPGSDALNAADPDASKAEFLIVRVLKGRELLGDSRKLKVLYFGDVDPGSKFLVLGNSPPELVWATPIALNAHSWEYLRQLQELPRQGPERLVVAFDYLEDKEEMLSRDAYDEFARAPYSMLRQVGPQLNPDQLAARIRKLNTPNNRLRLYVTLLGVCGGPQHVAMLEEIMRSGTPQSINALDTLTASYLRLKGAAGLPLVEQLFLRSESIDDAPKANAVINALRFHGQEPDVIPRQRIIEVMHKLLDRPQLAGRILADLARWEDWSVIDRVSDLFVKAQGDTLWVREPVVGYLQACPLPEAKKQLDRLAKIDPEVVQRGTSLFPPDSTVYLGGGPSTIKARSSTAATPSAASGLGSTGMASTGSSNSATEVVEPRNQPVIGSPGFVALLWRAGLSVAAAIAIVVLLGVVLTRRAGAQRPAEGQRPSSPPKENVL